MNTTQPAEGTPLAYQCALPLSRRTLTLIADLLRARLKKIGSRWRKLPPGKIALIVLATLRHDHRLAGMAGGNSVSASAIHRWTWEIIGLLAARAPVEHGFSDLKHWRILTRLRLSPAKATILLRALLVLTRQHTTR